MSLQVSSRRMLRLAVCVVLALTALWIVARSGPKDREVGTALPVPQAEGPVLVPSPQPGLRAGDTRVPETHVPDAPPATARSRTTITGRVLDKRTGASVSGAVVFVSGPSDPYSRHGATTDPEGAFRIDTDVRGEVMATALASGYVASTQLVKSTSEALTIEIEEGLAIRGTVVDDAGRGLQGVRVSASREPMGATWPSNTSVLEAGSGALGSWTISGQDGAFTLAGLEQRSYYLRGEIAGHTTDEARPPPQVSPGSDGARIVLLRIARLRILLLDDTSGAPLPFSTYYLSARPLRVVGPVQVLAPGIAESVPSPPGRIDVLLAPAIGSSKLPDSVTAALRVNVHGYKPVAESLPLVLGETQEHTLRVPRQDPRGWTTLRPVARFSDGSPFDGHLVLRFTSKAGDSPQSLSHRLAFADGVSSAGVDLPPGHYEVSPEGDYVNSTFWPVAGDGVDWVIPQREGDQATLVLRGNPLQLRVLQRDARVRFALLEIAGPASRGLAPWWDLDGLEPSDPQGDLRVIWVPPGRHAVWARTDGAPGKPVPVEADGSGKPIQVTLEVPQK